MADQERFFSIIIPTYSRPRQLKACLEALVGLEYPRSSFEVIVVDDGSPVPLDEIVVPFRQSLDITLLRQDNAGPASARNTGARRAKGSSLVFIDDDCAPAPDYLRALTIRAQQSATSAIGGRTVNALSQNIFSSASQLLNDYLYSYFNADPEHARFLTSNNMLVPTETFHALNGFDTTYRRAASEDRDLCDRLVRHGHNILYAPEAVVYHSHGMTLLQYWRQHFAYGRGAATFHRKRLEHDPGGRTIAPVPFYVNLVRYPFSHRSESPAMALAGLMLVAQLATAAGYFRERFAQRRRQSR
jgi:GT2 family glycosyltransferase